MNNSTAHPNAEPASSLPDAQLHFAPRPAHAQDDWLLVQSLDLEAKGVAHKADGKVVFIEGALPGEWVSAQSHRKKNNWEAATITALHHESSQRVRPGCPHFGLHAGACGGCKMQHLDAAAQVATKQRVLEDDLWHLGKCRAANILRPIHGPTWGYRWRARLSVRYVAKKGAVLIGFHERKSRYIADMQSCAILPAHVSAMLLPLRALIGSMQARETCPQLELACGDGVTALVLRHLEPLSDSDIAKLHAFAAQHPSVQWWLQPKGPDTAHCITPAAAQLAYSLPTFGITMPFKPADFTQVNPHINRVLINQALQLLDVQKNERVIDWFCGLGNFTLPLATQAGSVLGIEGSQTLVERAQANYHANRTTTHGQTLAPTQFVARNLFEMTAPMLAADGTADKWLVDPPREGAFALVKALADIHQQRLAATATDPSTKPNTATSADDNAVATPDFSIPADWQPPQRIVYVSCNPATLARDAGLLVHQAGYRISAAGVINMFPHTAHVESMAVFERV